MTYGTPIRVKDRCDIKMEDTEYDQKIVRAIAFSDALIDTMFADIDKTVPSSTPQIIIDASNDIATYYMLRSKQTETAIEYLVSGQKLVDQYLDAQYRKAGIGKIVTGQVASESSED